MQPSGLEVDKRQDESSNAARQIADGPELFLPSQAQEAEKVSPKSANAVHHDEIFGLRKATFLLSLALAIVTALGIVGVAVAGSVAAKRGRLVCGPNATASSANATSAPPAGPGNTTSLAPGLSPSSSNTNITPTDNCHDLPGKYQSPYSKANYTVSCGVDFPLGDMMSVFVYRFEDCIESCASYNAHIFNHSQFSCIRVSYDRTFDRTGGNGNCFLKTTMGLSQSGTNSDITSSATWIDG